MRGYDKQRLCLELLQELVPLPVSLFHRLNPVSILEDLIPSIEWMLETPLIDTPMRGISYRGQVYMMPAPGFENLRLEEYKEADKYYQKVFIGLNDSLPFFVAALLREVEEDDDERLKNDDCRQRFYSASHTKRAEVFKHLPAEVSFYVLQYFTHCKVALYEKYLAAFENKEAADDPESTWNDALTDVAENGTFGNYKDVLQLRVHVFYEWMAKNKRRLKIQEMKSLQEAIKKNHNKFTS